VSHLRWYSKVLFAVLAVAFAYFVWPTAWTERTVSIAVGITTTARTSRFTGRTEVLSPTGAWVDLERERQERAATDIATLVAALDLYAADNGEPPTTEQGLVALLRRPAVGPVPRNWLGPYLKRMARDPWGHEYVYRYPGQVNPDGYDLICYGADGVPAGRDHDADITNWRRE